MLCHVGLCYVSPLVQQLHEEAPIHSSHVNSIPQTLNPEAEPLNLTIKP